MITIEQERAFYDSQYAQFLKLPDHALRMDRDILRDNIGNPAHPFYERRALYLASMRALEGELAPRLKVLDYGCGPADFGLWMATEGADVTLLDVSASAIELGLKRAAASGIQVRGIAADASRLNMLADREFDLVFACAALHHTLKYPGAVRELARVMRPGALLVLCETWGANPLLNAARNILSAVNGIAGEQGEEIILSETILGELYPFFPEICLETYNLLAMGKRLLRGRFNKSWARSLVQGLEWSDRVLLSAVPPLHAWCGEALITGRRALSPL